MHLPGYVSTCIHLHLDTSLTGYISAWVHLCLNTSLYALFINILGGLPLLSQTSYLPSGISYFLTSANVSKAWVFSLVLSFVGSFVTLHFPASSRWWCYHHWGYEMSYKLNTTNTSLPFVFQCLEDLTQQHSSKKKKENIKK